MTITLAQFFKSTSARSLFDQSNERQSKQEGSMRLSINKNTSLFVLWFLYEVGSVGEEGRDIVNRRWIINSAVVVENRTRFFDLRYVVHVD